MTRRLVDLTLTIVPGTDWVQWPRRVIGQDEPKVKFEPISTIKRSGFFVQKFEISTQSYTHIDAPIHKIENAAGIDEVPLESLVGEAVVIDMSSKKAREAVTAKDLEGSGVEVKQGDIVIIRTDWVDKHWGTKEFWSDTVYLSEDACDWLIQKRIRALAVDFYNEVKPFDTCATCGVLQPLDTPYVKPKDKVSPNHHKFFKNNIVLVENLTNLKALKKDWVTLVALPLKLKGSDGAPARVIAIEVD